MVAVLFSLLFPSFTHAIQFQVLDSKGNPIPYAMVSERPVHLVLDTTDNGYPTERKTIPLPREITKFTNRQGLVTFQNRPGNWKYRFRRATYQDQWLQDLKKTLVPVKLIPESDPVVLANQNPANVWLAGIHFSNNHDKQTFQMQCGFCHQQAIASIRTDRSEDEWRAIIKRMIGYGSRLPTELQKKLPAILKESFLTLNQQSPNGSFPVWENLENITLTEWPMGDAMSQMHDVLVAKNGLVYVADNIQDRLWELDTTTDQVTVYKIPHLPDEPNGGLIAARLKRFPKHDSTSNAHSIAESSVDGHLFITPSAQRRLVEFDPASKNFTLYEMEKGFYPHTIRVDSKDQVWFTLALSNQVARFDRNRRKFTYYDLPARSAKEKFLTENIRWIFKIMNFGIPLSEWLSIDAQSTGTPLVYGIDFSYNSDSQKVYVTRLHTDEIGEIDPQTNTVTMIKTPFRGPRRLRGDAVGNLWMTSFGESKIAKFNPDDRTFEQFDLPVQPLGSETPYALGVDRTRNRIWVNGNQSDALYVFKPETNKWQMIPFSRKTTFTRDVDFDSQGNAYTSNSNFPAWHIEDAQPTLIKVEIGDERIFQKLPAKSK